MPKDFFQDLVKVKRARQGIKVKPLITKKISKNEEKKGSRNMLWVVAVVSVVFLFFALSYLFGSVTVTVNPKIKEVTLKESLSAGKDTTTDALVFDLVEIPGEENKIIQTTEMKDLLQKARGVAVIYNAYSTTAQNLDISTRLEGSNGKIYKTEKAIVVPGMKGTIPGSVEVFVVGSDAGEAYNSDPIDFKIFGFKGTPKYSGFYGRSKGGVTGGYKGKFPFVSDTEKTTLVNEMKTTLQNELFKKANDQIPDGFILFKDAAFLNTDDGTVDYTSAKGNMVPVKLTGIFYGLLFNESKLTKKIAEDTVKPFDESEIFMPNIKDLTFSLANRDNISFTDVTDINFTLSGKAKIVWKFDTDKLASDLLGKSKKDFNQILLQYPNIISAESVINPFWKMSFPDKMKDIKVIVNYPK
jgi:hypothetical protein